MGVVDQNVIACKEGFGLHVSRGKQRVAQLEHQANCLRERLSYLETVLPFGNETVKSEDSRPKTREPCETPVSKNPECSLQTLAAKEKTLRKEIYDMRRAEENYAKRLADKFDDSTEPKRTNPENDLSKAEEEADGEQKRAGRDDMRTRILRLEAYGRKLCTNLRNLQKDRCDLTQEAEDLSRQLDLTREGLGLKKKRSKKRCPNLTTRRLDRLETVDRKAKICGPVQNMAPNEEELKKRSGCPCGSLAKCRSCTICSCADWEKDLEPDALEKEEVDESSKRNGTPRKKRNDRSVNSAPTCRRCKEPKRRECSVTKRKLNVDCECDDTASSTSATSCECDCSDKLDYDASKMLNAFCSDGTSLIEAGCLLCQSSCSVCHACQDNSKFVETGELHKAGNIKRCRGGVDHVIVHDEPSCTSDWTCNCDICVKTKKEHHVIKGTRHKDDDVSIPEKMASDITCTCNLCDRIAILREPTDCGKTDGSTGKITCLSNSKMYHVRSNADLELEKPERCRGGVDTDPSLSECTCSCTLCALRNSEAEGPPCCKDRTVVRKEKLPCGCDEDDEELPVHPAMSPEISKLCHVTQLRESLEKLKNRNHALRKLLKDCGCQASSVQNDNDAPKQNSPNGLRAENSGDHSRSHPITPNSAAGAGSLIVTLKTLQSKCRIKDGMIVALADELKRNGTPEQTRRILRSLADPDLSKQTNDFDRATLWTYLTQGAKSASGRCVSGDLEAAKDFAFGTAVLSLVFFSTVVRAESFLAVSKLARESLENAHELIGLSSSWAGEVLSRSSEKASAAFAECVSLLTRAFADGRRFLADVSVVEKRQNSGDGVWGSKWVECLLEFFWGITGLAEVCGKSMQRRKEKNVNAANGLWYFDFTWFTFCVIVFFALSMLRLLRCWRSSRRSKGEVVGQGFRKRTFVYVLCVVFGYVTNKILNSANFSL